MVILPVWQNGSSLGEWGGGVLAFISASGKTKFRRSGVLSLRRLQREAL